ncbi:MAG: AAA family ATPase [Spirochaetales bacterium]
MPSTRDIESELRSIANWTHVSFKKNIIGTLGKNLDAGERIDNVLEGFYQGLGITGTGSGAPGIFCITDRRMLFLLSGKTAAPPEVLDYESVVRVETKRGYSSTKISIHLLDGEVQLTAVTKSNQVNSFLNHLAQKIEAPLEEAGADHEADQSRIANLNFLHNEARKIFLSVNEFKQFNGEPSFLRQVVDDLFVIAFLAISDASELSEETRLFISMVFMPLRQRVMTNRSIIEDLFRYDSLPLHHRKVILANWHTLNNEIQKVGRSKATGSLKTLTYLKAYDENEDTTHFDRVASTFNSFAQVAVKADGTISPDEESRIKRIRSVIYGETEEISEERKSREKKAAKRAKERESEPEESLEDLLTRIDRLIGMDRVKEQIRTFINLIIVQQERKKLNLPTTPVSLHAVFYGPPGTGKTTIARLLGKVYRALGLLEEGHLVETDRAGLVAGYVGQTAIKIDEVVQDAMGGVLFIDEAYALAMNKGDKDFGQEAIDTLLKRMEDHREELAVIVAGYPDEMKEFVNSNPGLKSRFNRFFYFDHYEPEELLEIFDIFIENASFTLTGPARKAVLSVLTEFYERRGKSFGNGRFVRNLFERMVERQANRIASVTPLTEQVLCALTKADVPTHEELREHE